MNKSKGQRLLKYIAGIYFLSSALFLWSCSPKEIPPQIVDLKEIVAMNAIPSQSDLSSYSQDLQNVLGPLAGDTAKTLGAIYVSENGAGAQDGSSWDNAYAGAELKTAIDKAGKAANATKPYLVLIASGTYSIGETLNMKNNVAIIGGLNNNWSPDKTERSILDGAGSTQIFSNLGIDSRAILYGVSITDGSTFESGGGMLNYNASPTLNQIIFSENIADDSGGGMYNVYSSPILNQVTFSDNLSIDGNGGGMANYESSPTLVQVTFSENTAGDGGGMANYESSPTLVQVTFSENTAEDGGGMYNNHKSSPILEAVTFSGNTASYGGGMFNYESSPTLKQVTFLNNRTTGGHGGGMSSGNSSPILVQVRFSGNTAQGEGGGMSNYKSSPTLVQVTFSENTAGDGGGGMRNDKSSPILKQVTFSGNTAATESGGGMHNEKSSPTLKQVAFSSNKARWGGGIYNDKSSPILEAVTFSGNIAERDGGGISNDESSPTLKQVTFSNNKAGWSGGGMDNYKSSPILNQVTFSNNSATRNGGGMYNDNEGKIGPSISNSIFWGNTPNQIYMRNDSNKGNENLQIYYSILEGGSAEITSYDNSEGDPVNITSYGLVDTEDAKLDSKLTDNGGFVQTLALESGSPAIDAGIYVQKSDDNYYYSEDASTWYSALDGDGLSNKITLPNAAIDLTATDARGYAIVGRPDLGAYESGAKAP